jgi:3-oxoacyl-[acyl-carrier protein] reductase
MNDKNKVAIVTGAAGSGMGRNIALTLAREGIEVVVNYRTSEGNALAITRHIESRGGKGIAVQADVFEETIKQFGRVDICIVGPGGGWHPEPIDGLDPTAAMEDVHHEVAPLFYLMPLVLPGMYRRNWGRLIGIALHPTRLPLAYSYNVAKAARAQALLLAQDQAGPHGVTVNVIVPGPVSQIQRLEEAIEQCDHGSAWQKRTDVSPQDVAEGVAFLCSEAGRFISGCTLPYLCRS